MGIVLLAGGTIYLFNYASTFDHFYWIIGSYVLVCILLYLIKQKIRNKVFYFIVQVILFPLDQLFKFIILVLPVIATQIYLFVYLGLSYFIPLILYIIDLKLNFTGLKNETWIYLIATTGSISATLFHKQITYLTFKIIPFTSRKSWKIKRLELCEVCEYIVSKHNVKLITYTMFFITLIIFTILGLQERSYYINSNIDNAILQSFATFIAFERILNNLELTEFKASELLETLKLSIYKNKKTK